MLFCVGFDISCRYDHKDFVEHDDFFSSSVVLFTYVKLITLFAIQLHLDYLN